MAHVKYSARLDLHHSVQRMDYTSSSKTRTKAESRHQWSSRCARGRTRRGASLGCIQCVCNDFDGQPENERRVQNRYEQQRPPRLSTHRIPELLKEHFANANNRISLNYRRVFRSMNRASQSALFSSRISRNDSRMKMIIFRPKTLNSRKKLLDSWMHQNGNDLSNPSPLPPLLLSLSNL